MRLFLIKWAKTPRTVDKIHGIPLKKVLSIDIERTLDKVLKRKTSYFLNLAYLDLNLSIRPAESTNFILPV
jgi:hypothetical protein